MNTAARTQISLASRQAKLTGLTVVAAAILAACGGGGSDPATNVVTPPTQTAQSVALLTTVTTTTYAAGSQDLDAFNTLNAQRMQCGFGAISQSALLDTIAKNHSTYMRDLAGRGIDQPDLHSEDPAQPLFKGETADIRAVNQGYKTATGGAAWVSEVIQQSWTTKISTSGIGSSVIATGEYNIRSWLSAPYHGMTALAEYTEVGIGILPPPALSDPTSIASLQISTLDFGSGTLGVGQLPTATGSAGVRTYPCQGVTGVLPALYGESPMPINRNMSLAPSGHPIMVLGDYGKTLTLTSASIIEVPTGRSLPINRLSTQASGTDNNPNHLRGPQWGYVLPDVPMLPNTAYSVTVSGTNDGQAFTRNFTFSTGIDNGDYQKLGNK